MDAINAKRLQYLVDAWRAHCERTRHATSDFEVDRHFTRIKCGGCWWSFELDFS